MSEARFRIVLVIILLLLTFGLGFRLRQLDQEIHINRDHVDLFNSRNQSYIQNHHTTQSMICGLYVLMGYKTPKICDIVYFKGNP